MVPLRSLTLPAGTSSKAPSGTTSALHQVLATARSLSAAGHPHEVLQIACRTACEALGYDACAAALRGEDGTFRYEAVRGLGERQELDLRSRVMSSAVFELLIGASLPLGSVHWVPPGSPVLGYAEVEAAVSPSGAGPDERGSARGSLLLVPLVADDAAVVGFLEPDDPGGGGPPTADEAVLLAGLAELAGAALGTVAAREDARAALAVAEAQRRQLEELLTASVALRGGEALDDVLGGIAQAMTSAGGFRRAAIYLLEDDRRTLRVRATVGLGPAEDQRLRSTPVPLAELEAMMRPEMRVGRSFLFDHRRHQLPAELESKLSVKAADPRWREGMWHALDTLTVPLRDRSGALCGVISVDEPASGRMPALAHIRAVEMFAEQCSLAVVEARRYEQALAEAGTDPLTGLANRRALLARAAEVIAESDRRQAPCSVAFLDLDHFKEVNDRFGHGAGDEVLVSVAGALTGRLRAGDLVARYGGEEMVVVLPGTSLGDAVAIVEELRQRVAGLELEGLRGHRVRVSAGVALVAAGESLEESLARADRALYEAKRAGRDRLCVAEGSR